MRAVVLKMVSLIKLGCVCSGGAFIQTQNDSPQMSSSFKSKLNIRCDDDGSHYLVVFSTYGFRLFIYYYNDFFFLLAYICI